MEVNVPSLFLCPISLDLMKDPVTLSTGITYDRESIDRWIQSGHSTCPVSNQRLSSSDQIPNHFIRRMIQSWCVDNRSNGVERIPTPRAPITSFEVHQICSRLARAVDVGDKHRCFEMFRKLKSLANESERNKKCIAENDAVEALSSAFEWFSKEGDSSILEELLSILVWMKKTDKANKMGSSDSVRGIQTVIKNGALSSRNDAVLVLRNLVTARESMPNTLLETQGMLESLMSVLKGETTNAITNATLTILSRILHQNGRVSSSLVRMGVVEILVRKTLAGDKTTGKRALIVLNSVCESDSGRAKAYENSLLVPMLVTKVGASPDAAADASLSVLWKLWKGRRELVKEMVEMKLFEKLLVYLQVGCLGDTKQKVKDLLRAMNAHSKCLHEDFRYLKVPN